jgi:hypothetical protein
MTCAAKIGRFQQDFQAHDIQELFKFLELPAEGGLCLFNATYARISPLSLPSLFYVLAPAGTRMRHSSSLSYCSYGQ